MRHRPHAAPLLVLSLAAAPALAHAQVVETNNSGSATATANFGPGSFLPSRSDVRSFGPNGGAAVAELDYRAFGTIRAVQTGYGLNAVLADARVADIPSFDFSARADYDLTLRNDGPRAVPLDFTFQLNGGHLRLYDPSERFGGTVASVNVSIFAIAPLNSGFLWSWDVVLRGDGAGGVTATVDFLIDPHGFGVPHLGPVTVGGGVASVAIAPFAFALEMGRLAPNGTATLAYDMGADVAGFGFPWGGYAALGDPFDAAGDYGVSATLAPAAVSAVPEPSVVSLSTLGLAALGALAARRRRQRAAARPTAAA
jgi:hypothetical protein